MKLPGIYVEIKGDYSDLERKMREAKSIVTSQSAGISNALNNALSPNQVKGNIDKIVGAFSTLNRAASVSKNTFSQIGSDLGELRKITGLTEKQFASLQSQLLKTQAANAQENALRRIATACGLAEKEVRQLGLQFGLSLAQINKVTGSNTQIDNITSATKTAESSMLSFGSTARIALGFLSAGAIVEFGRSVVDTGIKLDSLNRSFVAITGSQELASAEMQAMRKIADATGQNFYALADDYRQLSAATKGSALEGAKTRDAFMAISEAGAVLGLSNEKVSLSLKALGQMASKGTVQMEELKGQLGDSLPGAVQITARALGKNTEQLYKMAEKGELLAENVIPALSKELHNLYQTAANSAALESGQAAMNKMAEAWTELKASFYDNDAVVGSINAITAALKGMSAVLQAIKNQPAGAFDAVTMQAEAAGALSSEEAALKRIALLKEQIAKTESNISLVSGNRNMLPDVQTGALKQLNEQLMNQRIELEKLDGTLVATSAKEKQFAGDLKNRVAVTEQVIKATAKQREATEKYLETERDRAKKEYEAAKAGAAGDTAKLLAVEKKYKEELAEIDKRAADAAKRAGAGARQQYKEFESLLNSVITTRKEQEKYEKQIAALDKALAAGKITQEQYNEGVKNAEQAMSSYKDKIKAAKEEVKKLAGATKEADKWRTEVNRALMTDTERRIDALRTENEELKTGADLVAKRYGDMSDWAAKAKEGLDKKLIEDIRAVEDEASQMGKLFDKVAEDIQDASSDMFLDMLNGTDDAMDAIGQMFKKLLAELASMAIARPIMIPVVSSLGSAMGLSQGTIAKSLGMDTSQLSAMSGGGLFSTSGLTGMQVDLATMLDNKLGLTSLAESISGMNSTLFSGLAGGGLSLGLSLLSGQGLTAQTGLQAAGAGIGSAFGGPLGGVIGGLLGNLAGGLFGDNGPDTFQFTPASQAYGSNYVAGKGISISDFMFTGGDTDSNIYKVYAEQIKSIQAAFNEQIGSFAAALPAEIAQTMQAGLAAVDLRQTLIDSSKGEFEAQNAEDAIAQVAQRYSTALTSALGNSYADAVQAFINQNGVAGLFGDNSAWGMLTAGAQSNVSGSIANSIEAIRAGDAAGGTVDIQAAMQAISQIGAAMAPITEIIETNGLTEYELAIRSINKQFEQYQTALVAAGVDMSRYTDFYSAWNMQLSDAAERFSTVAKDVADALATATDQLKASFSAEQSSISAFHSNTLSALNTQLQAAQQEVSDLTSLSSMLQSAMRSIKIEGMDFERNQRIVAQGILQQAMGGNVDQSKLSDALQTLSQGSTGLFSTFEDYARDQLKTSIAIDKLNAQTKDNLSTAEQQVAYIEEQIELENKWYEDELKRLDDQLNALLGINTSVLTLADAIANFQTAQAASNAIDSGSSSGTSGISDADYYAAKVEQLNSISYLGNSSWTTSAVQAAFTAAGYTVASHWLNAGQYENLPRPSFASGTDYVPYDMVANIHKGERIVPAAYNRSDSSNVEIVNELRVLRETVRAMVAQSKKTADTLDQWEHDGMPETRTA